MLICFALDDGPYCQCWRETTNLVWSNPQHLRGLLLPRQDEKWLHPGTAKKSVGVTASSCWRMGESWAISTLHLAEVLCSAEKSVSQAELQKRTFRKEHTKLFHEGIRTELSALNRFKLDLLLDRRAVCEVRGCTSNTWIIIWLLQIVSPGLRGWQIHPAIVVPPSADCAPGLIEQSSVANPV